MVGKLEGNPFPGKVPVPSWGSPEAGEQMTDGLTVQSCGLLTRACGTLAPLQWMGQDEVSLFLLGVVEHIAREPTEKESRCL